MTDAPSIAEFSGLPPERHAPVGGPLGNISEMMAAVTRAANSADARLEETKAILQEANATAKVYRLMGEDLREMFKALKDYFHVQQRHWETSLAMRCGYAEAQHGPGVVETCAQRREQAEPGDTLPAHIVGGD